eukprot:8333205-Lingulodinium_polyedra.AAC.1
MRHKLGRIFQHAVFEEPHARNHKRVVVNIPLAVANGSPHDQIRNVHRANERQESAMANNWAGCRP